MIMGFTGKGSFISDGNQLKRDETMNSTVWKILFLASNGIKAAVMEISGHPYVF